MQVESAEGSLLGSMVALKLFPPTIWWRCGETRAPGLTKLPQRSDTCSRERNRIEYGSMRSMTSCEHDIFKVGGKILGGSSWNPSTSRLRLFKPSSKLRFIVTLCRVWLPKGRKEQAYGVEGTGQRLCPRRRGLGLYFKRTDYLIKITIHISAAARYYILRGEVI